MMAVQGFQHTAQLRLVKQSSLERGTPLITRLLAATADRHTRDAIAPIRWQLTGYDDAVARRAAKA